ncbi:MAG: MaoC/PaaZ C-terminal domain-containing protein [Burkholderiales bacterium]
MTASTLHASGLAIGQSIPPQARTFTTVDLVAYGAATWDWHRLHYDVDYARSVNLPNVIIDGQAYGGVFAKALIDWAGPRAFIRKLSLKYKSMAFAGDKLVATGEVTAIHADGDHDIVSVTQRLKNGDRVVAEANAQVRLPR